MSVAEPIQFGCQCGKSFRVAPKFAGKTTPCPNCKTILTIPATSDVSGQKRSAEPKRDVDPPGKAEPAESCPNCGADFPASRMTCDQCRYSRRLGKCLPQTEVPANRPAKPAKVKAAKPKKKRESMFVDSPIQWGTMAGGVMLIAVAVLWFGAGLLAGVIFFYPIVMVFIGVGMMVKGLLGG